MAAETIFLRHSENFRGLDKRTSDIKRTNDYATEIKNAQLRVSGAINKRKGFHINQEHYDGNDGISSYGTVTYKNVIRSGLPANVEGTEGAVVDRLLKVSDDLWVLEEDNLDIAYEGEFNLWHNIVLDGDSNKFFYELYDEGDRILNIDLGTGVDGTGEPVADLAAAIDSVELPVMRLNNIPAQILRDENLVPVYPFVLKIKNEEITSIAKLKLKTVFKLSSDEQDEFLTVTNFEATQTEDLDENAEDYDLQIWAQGYDYILTLEGDSTSLSEANGGNVFVTTKYSLSASYPITIASKRAAFFDLMYQEKINTALVTYDGSGNELSRVSGLTKLPYKYWRKIDTVPNALVMNAANTGYQLSTTNAFNWTVENVVKVISDGDTSYNVEQVDVRKTEQLENATFAQLNNVMYISNGISNVMKYDSREVYRAGLPNAAILVGNILTGEADTFDVTVNQTTTTYKKVPMEASGGDISQTKVLEIPAVEEVLDDNGNVVTAAQPAVPAGTTRQYKFVYEYTDAKGNLITSQASDPITVYYTSGGSPTGVTIKVPPITHPHLNWHLDPANTDANGKPYNHDISRLGFNIQSDNLVVKIYRTKDYQSAGVPGNFYLVNVNYTDEDVNNLDRLNDCSNVQGQSYVDNITDEGLNKLLVYSEPIKRQDPPPKGKYITAHKNLLVVSGDRDDLNNVAYSLPKNLTTSEIGSEYFPNDENAVTVESPVSSKITAIASLRDLLYVFHQDSISVLSGAIDDPEGIPSVDLLTREGGIGCVAQSSIQEVQNSLAFLSNKGIYMVSGGGLQETSSLVKPKLLDPELKKKRCVSFVWTEQSLVLFCIPKEALDNTDSYYTTDSLILVYDYYHNAWLEWTNIDITGGIDLYKDAPHFNSRVADVSQLKTFNNTSSTYDYCDHTEPIYFEYQTNWESLAEPSVFKKFTRIKLFAQDTDETFETAGFNLTVTMQKDYEDKDIASMVFDYGKGIAGGWGIDPWGMFPWGNNSTSVFKAKLPSTKAKCLKLEFTNNTENENILITNYEIEVRMPYRKDMKE